MPYVSHRILINAMHVRLNQQQWNWNISEISWDAIFDLVNFESPSQYDRNSNLTMCDVWVSNYFIHSIRMKIVSIKTRFLRITYMFVAELSLSLLLELRQKFAASLQTINPLNTFLKQILKQNIRLSRVFLLFFCVSMLTDNSFVWLSTFSIKKFSTELQTKSVDVINSNIKIVFNANQLFLANGLPYSRMLALTVLHVNTYI